MEEIGHGTLVMTFLAILGMIAAGIGFYVRKTTSDAESDAKMVANEVAVRTERMIGMVDDKLDDIRADHVRRVEFESMRQKIDLIGENQKVVMAELGDARQSIANLTSTVTAVQIRLAEHEREEKPA